MPDTSMLPPWLFARSTDPSNVYHLRANLAGRLLVWIGGGIAFTLLAGSVVVGLFAPSYLWIVLVVSVLLVVAGVIDFAFIIYCHYCSYKDYGLEQDNMVSEMKSFGDTTPTVTEGQVIVTEIKEDT